MQAMQKPECLRRTRSLPASGKCAAPAERVRVKRTVYAYDNDTRESAVIFGKRAASEGVSRAIDAKVGDRTVSIESYPDVLKLLDKFRMKVSSKKGMYSTRLLLNSASAEAGHAWTSPLSIYRALRKWARQFLPLEVIFGCKGNAERFLRNFKNVLGSGKCSHIRVQGRGYPYF